MSTDRPDVRQTGLDPRSGLRCLTDKDGACRIATPGIRPPFDVFTATDEQLLAYGFGPRPRDPVLFRIWHRMYYEQPRFVETRLRRSSNFATSRFLSADGEEEVDTGHGGAGGRSRLGGSANWCGGAILPRDGLRVVQIGARWVIPTVTPGVGTLPPWACSTWIGIEGLRSWMNSMPQMGTTQTHGSVAAPSGQPSFAWVQWWLRRRGVQEPVVVEDLPIAPGNDVACIMSLVETTAGDPGTQQARCEIANLSTGESALPVILVPLDAQGRAVPTAAASAQWILERPTALVADGAVEAGKRYPLPEFSAPPLPTFRFLDIGADFAARPGAAQTVGRDLTAPRLIRMRKHADQPDRTMVIAEPKRLPSRVRLDVAYREKG